MKIFVPKESDPNETRIAMPPDVAAKLTGLGAEVVVEEGLGSHLNYTSEDYQKGSVIISNDREASLKEADIVLRLGLPSVEEIGKMKEGSIHVSHLDPFNHGELLDAFAKAKVTAICMELMPRTTIAQKMDALSSQANLAGYVAVILAAERLNRIFPMLITPAGTISPVRVLVIGAGVAGLQAIATAKRLGARVEAYDTRPVVEEQVRSVGAKFLKIDLGETGETKDGYAKELTEEQLQKQREAMAKFCANADVVITTAKVFGRKAPLIITKEMVDGMKKGSIIVDLAAETGGNVEYTEKGKEIDVNGVHIIGFTNYAGLVPVDASAMYGNNLFHLLDHFWNKEEKKFELNMEDEILQGAVVTLDGKIVHSLFKDKN
ncbi:MAG: Re/Si-specific NAD(P)(+) transhydrogenase subunit alpha [Planctomycetota bacterium]|nr:MAG: Re/Si-specific NAD(P)(+) transhydrogenase subunit alpha [Planctomycetota bacterium]